MALRPLHTADWQIGRICSQFEPDDAAALFQARFNTRALRLGIVAGNVMPCLDDPQRAQRVAAARQGLNDALAQQSAAQQRVDGLGAELQSVNLALLRHAVPMNWPGARRRWINCSDCCASSAPSLPAACAHRCRSTWSGTRC